MYITEEMRMNTFTPEFYHRHYQKPVVEMSDDEMSPEYVIALINDYESSDNRQYMKTTEQYYHDRHDILDQKRMVIGRASDNTPALMESKVLSNNHLVHNFFRKLTRQKLGYLLSNAFSFQPDTHEVDRCKSYFQELNKYYDLQLYQTIKSAARDGIVDGIGWIYIYYDEEGKMKFKHIPATEVIPEWVDIDHKDLRSVIRKYKMKEFKNNRFEEVTYIEHYTKKGVIKYKCGTASITDANSLSLEVVQGLTPYFKIKTEDQEIDATWTDIPFIPFKYDSDEYSLLRRIKSLIDDYDRKTSDIANMIDDMPNSVTVVKNYDGASKEEFVQNKNQYRTIFVQGDGDAYTLSTPTNIDELDIHLKRLREDIYEFGQGVNTADKDIRDTSGVALRFLYGDLDMDCANWGDELKWSLYLMNWFISRDILLNTGEDYSDINYDIVFNVSMIVNESEVINNVLQSKGVVSEQTLLSNHPWVLDADHELRQIEEDDERSLTKLQEQEDIMKTEEGEKDGSVGNDTVA